MRIHFLVGLCLVLSGACRYEPPLNRALSASRDSAVAQAAELQPPASVSGSSREAPGEVVLRQVEAELELRARAVPTGGDVVAPVTLKRVEPVYLNCKGKQAWGSPAFDLVIDEKGDVRDARLLRPAHPCVAQATLDAIKQWKFKPATRDGKPIPVTYNLTVFVHYSR